MYTYITIYIYIYMYTHARTHTQVGVGTRINGRADPCYPVIKRLCEVGGCALCAQKVKYRV